MSEISLKVKAFFTSEQAASLNTVFNEAMAEGEAEFQEVIKGLSVDTKKLDISRWYLVRSSYFRGCLSFGAYGRGEETDVCKVMERLGAELIAVEAFDDRVAEKYELGWRNGKQITQRTLRAELKKRDPHLAFLDAITRGNANAVAEFIADGVELNAEVGGTSTPLMYAADNGRANIIELLIGAGADVNYTNKHRRTALIYSLRHIADQIDHDDISALELLLMAGANPNVLSVNPYKIVSKMRPNAEYVTPLMLASKRSPLAVTLLTNYSADVNLSNGQGHTPLMFAANTYLQASLPCVSPLIKCGADLNAMDEEGNTCVDYADSDEVRYMLRSEGARYATFKYGDNAVDNLYRAIEYDDMEMVDEISRTINIHEGSEIGGYKRWPLTSAIAKRRFQIARYLVNTGSDPKSIDQEHTAYCKNRKNLLCAACEAGRLDAVQLLLDHGVNRDFVNDTGETAMDAALNCRLPKEYAEVNQIVEVLLQNNVPKGNSLASVAQNGHNDVADLLLKEGALDETVDVQKTFEAAIFGKNLELIKNCKKWFVDHGASLFHLTCFQITGGKRWDAEDLEFKVSAALALISEGINVNELYGNTCYWCPLQSITMALIESDSLAEDGSENAHDISGSPACCGCDSRLRTFDV